LACIGLLCAIRWWLPVGWGRFHAVTAFTLTIVTLIATSLIMLN
jgi:hypothetical protein